MASSEGPAFVVGCAIEAHDYNPHKRILTVRIGSNRTPDMTRSTRFCDERFPDAIAMHVIAGDTSNIVFFKGEDGWSSVSTRVPAYA